MWYQGKPHSTHHFLFVSFCFAFQWAPHSWGSWVSGNDLPNSICGSFMKLVWKEMTFFFLNVAIPIPQSQSQRGPENCPGKRCSFLQFCDHRVYVENQKHKRKAVLKQSFLSLSYDLSLLITTPPPLPPWKPLQFLAEDYLFKKGAFWTVSRTREKINL